jgi:hypothetical protein
MPTPLHVTSASWNQPSLLLPTGLAQRAPCIPKWILVLLKNTYVDSSAGEGGYKRFRFKNQLLHPGKEGMHEFNVGTPAALILFALVADVIAAGIPPIVCCNSTSTSDRYNIPFSPDWECLVSATSNGSCSEPFTAEFGHPYRASAALPRSFA